MGAFEQIGVFAGQSAVIFIFIAALIVLIAILVAKSAHKNELQVETLNDHFDQQSQQIKALIMTDDEWKTEKKKLKEKMKSQAKESKSKVYVIHFNGSMNAHEVESLREEVTAILSTATHQDEVVVCLESPGGVVHGYGLAASQLLRIRNKGIPLTICVDKVAASGGYMMAATGNKILAAPFAIVGSVGVIAQVPNFHRLLKKYDVDYKEYTAGEFKRTVSLLGEITEKGEEKFKEQLEDTHQLFKNFIHHLRPHLDLSKVATGEYWYGEQALKLGLIDGIQTSDDYLLGQATQKKIVKIKFEKKQPFSEKLSGILGKAISRAALRTVDELELRRLP